MFIGRTGAEAAAPIFWPPDAKNWLIGEDPDAGKDWRKEEKRVIENEMVGWHHWLNGHEFEQTLGVGDGQASLACCSTWVAESDMTKGLNWLKWVIYLVLLCLFASLVSKSASLCTAAHRALSMGFSREEYWSGLPCPPPGNLLHPGIQPESPISPALQTDSLLLSHWENPAIYLEFEQKNFP